MFIALYEMLAKPGCEAEFEHNWAKVTEAIFRVRGSFGSRLHRTETSRTYIAYAQWPSKDVFDNEPTNPQYTPEEADAFQRMKAAAESIRTLHRMEVCNDLLKPVR